jgi:hypothetical protein
MHMDTPVPSVVVLAIIDTDGDKKQCDHWNIRSGDAVTVDTKSTCQSVRVIAATSTSHFMAAGQDAGWGKISDGTFRLRRRLIPDGVPRTPPHR